MYESVTYSPKLIEASRIAFAINDKNMYNKSKLSIESITRIVCDFERIQRDALFSTSRERHIVQARQRAMYFAKNKTKSSLADIAYKIGKRDHSTCIHSAKTVKNLMFSDIQYRNEILQIEKLINEYELS